MSRHLTLSRHAAYEYEGWVMLLICFRLSQEPNVANHVWKSDSIIKTSFTTLYIYNLDIFSPLFSHIYHLILAWHGHCKEKKHSMWYLNNLGLVYPEFRQGSMFTFCRIVITDSGSGFWITCVQLTDRYCFLDHI